MPLTATESPARRVLRRTSTLALIVLGFVLTSSTPISRSSSSTAQAPTAVNSVPVVFAEVNFADLAARAQVPVGLAGEPRPLINDELEEGGEPGAGQSAAALAPETSALQPAPRLLTPGPGTSKDYAGLNDIAMVDSNYIIIPPDVAGGVGPTKVMESFNNNYRIRDKATGVTQLTVGTATFWNPVITNKALLNQLTDPRTTYDPYQNRWIVAMQTVNNPGLMLFGVSQTSDPAGSWFLYAVAPNFGSGTAPRLDFPIIGFNKNWIAMTINAYSGAGAFQRGGTLVANYPQAAAGTLGSVSLFTQAAGTHFATAPAVTYSATEDTLFLVTHLGSAGATYTVDVITGTPAAPVYTVGGTNVRPGGGWVQPSGQLLPQSAPNAGASSCGATPCKIETQDAQIRTSPVYRNGFLYYVQTIGLPSTGLTHTAAQWTKITPSTTPAFVDGGRLEDAAATSTNGGKWYAYPAISVNSTNDFMIGFSQFSSAQHPSAGFAYHYGTDPAGSLRDPFVYHAGEDYYSKTFGSGRNRWGDFTTTQVDPCNDQTIWTLQEYARLRTSTDDGNTGSNGSKWGSWWAAVDGLAPTASVTCPGNTIGAPGGSVGLTFRVTNTGTASSTFDYSVSDNAGWGGPSVGTTPVLAPSAFYDVFVNFNVPGNCTPPSDIVTFSAQVTGATGCYSAVQCQMTISCDLATAALYSRFDVAPVGAGVDITWSSDAVSEVRGWNVYRAATENGGWTRINETLIPMGAGGDFRVHDDAGTSGSRFYRLNAVMLDGTETALSSQGVTLGSASYSFAVAGSNPFNNRLTLRYTLPRAEHVKMNVYSVTGQLVRTLVDRNEAPGAHSVDFSLRDGRALQPGVYMVRITAGSFSKSLRVIGIE